MQPWKKLEARVGNGARWVALFGVLFLVGLSLATIADVLGRWLFNHPLDGVTDLYNLVMAIVVAAFFPIALIERRHISIEFLGNLLGARGRLWLNALAGLATFVFIILLGWQIVKYVFELHATGETTWILRWSKVPWWAIAAVLIVICIPIQLLVLLSDTSSAAAPGTRAAGDDTSPANSHQPTEL